MRSVAGDNATPVEVEFRRAGGAGGGVRQRLGEVAPLVTPLAEDSAREEMLPQLLSLRKQA